MVKSLRSRSSVTSRARRCVVVDHQVFERARQARRHVGDAQAEIGGADDLALAHWNAAQDLRQEFTDADRDQQLLDLAQRAGDVRALGKGADLADALGIGREPGEAVGGALLAVEQAVDRVGIDPDPRAHGGGRVVEDRVRGQGRLARQGEEFEAGIAPGRLLQHLHVNPPRRLRCTPRRKRCRGFP